MRRCAPRKLPCDSSISELVFDCGANWEKLSERTSLTLNMLFFFWVTDQVSVLCRAFSTRETKPGLSPKETGVHVT